MRSSLSKVRFLIVENDPNDVFLIKRAISSTRCGANCTVCNNPLEAKAYLSGAEKYSDRIQYPLPDLIITDLKMEGETGIDLVRWLRSQRDPLCLTPLVILTGSASPQQIMEAEEAGTQKICPKPTKHEDLVHLVIHLAQQYCKADKPLGI